MEKENLQFSDRKENLHFSDRKREPTILRWKKRTYKIEKVILYHFRMDKIVKGADEYRSNVTLKGGSLKIKSTLSLQKNKIFSLDQKILTRIKL